MNRADILGFFQQITRPALSNAEALALAERLRAHLPQRKRKPATRKASADRLAKGGRP